MNDGLNNAASNWVLQRRVMGGVISVLCYWYYSCYDRDEMSGDLLVGTSQRSITAVEGVLQKDSSVGALEVLTGCLWPLNVFS
jgi:hypothetical protein